MDKVEPEAGAEAELFAHEVRGLGVAEFRVQAWRLECVGGERHPQADAARGETDPLAQFVPPQAGIGHRRPSWEAGHDLGYRCLGGKARGNFSLKRARQMSFADRGECGRA